MRPDLLPQYCFRHSFVRLSPALRPVEEIPSRIFSSWAVNSGHVLLHEQLMLEIKMQHECFCMGEVAKKLRDRRC